jgi:signal transduction histidine kinase
MGLKFWTQLKLSTRIFGILFLLLFTTFGMGLTLIWYAGLFNGMLNQVVVEDTVSLQAAREMETSLANQKGFATYYFLDGDTKWLKELSVHRREFILFLDKAYEVNQGTTAIQLLDQIREKYERYITDKDKVIEMYKVGDLKTGESLHWDVRKNFFELNNLCRQYTHAMELNIRGTLEVSRVRVQRISTAAVIFMLVTLILLALLVVVMISQILFPIRRLSREDAMADKPDVPGNEVKALSKRVHGLMEDMNRTRSELEQSQELLLNSEKMALCGKLATEVAHSIRNPMTSINMRLFSLKRSLELTDFQQEDFEVVSEEMRRLDNIVRNFLEFSRPHKLKKQRINISDVINKTLALLCHRLELHSVTVIRKQSEGLSRIEADSELLKEVFVNLIVNACEAMEDGGEIVISEEDALAEKIGRAVVVKVQDNGPGMSDEIQGRVMEPFETTKADGTGLGLFIAVRIVEEHGGTLELRSKEGFGTTFTLTFPVFEEVSA